MPIIDMAKYMAERRRNRRAQLIEMLGGECARCGAKENLHFDHKDPKQQEFRLNGKNLDGSWEKILKETEKCQLLCQPCHVKKTKEDGYPPPWNKGISKSGEQLPEHGCEASYMHGCRCNDCCQARYEAKVRRGELKGTRGRIGPRKKLACGEMASFSAVTGTLSVRVGLGQPA